jgi:hypothetical protein
MASIARAAAIASRSVVDPGSTISSGAARGTCAISGLAASCVSPRRAAWLTTTSPADWSHPRGERPVELEGGDRIGLGDLRAPLLAHRQQRVGAARAAATIRRRGP